MFKQVFASRDDFLKWARKITYDFRFVIIILRSNTANRQRERKTCFVKLRERR